MEMHFALLGGHVEVTRVVVRCRRAVARQTFNLVTGRCCSCVAVPRNHQNGQQEWQQRHSHRGIPIAAAAHGPPPPRARRQPRA
eukprot:COSAG01_NODE_8472_length_2773_cov_77.844428_1_plen_83_part_10